MPCRKCKSPDNVTSAINRNIKEPYTYEYMLELKQYFAKKTQIEPKIGIICGSGLGSLGDAINDCVTIDYKDIPKFPKATAPGHKGRLIFGFLKEVPVMCMQGRFHYYEGYSLPECVMPVKLMKILGVQFLIVSNAAGGINSEFKVGDIMLIKDHFNIMGLAGNHPLTGFNDPRWGPRFAGLRGAYDTNILQEVKQITLKNQMHEGVYACVGGPTYETVAELKALKLLGADAVGMSTVHEIIAGKYCGLRCFAFSLITNRCSLDYDNEDDNEVHEEAVLQVGRSQQEELKTFVQAVAEIIRHKFLTKSNVKCKCSKFGSK